MGVGLPSPFFILLFPSSSSSQGIWNGHTEEAHIRAFRIPFSLYHFGALSFFSAIARAAIPAKEAATGKFRSPNINDGTRYTDEIANRIPSKQSHQNFPRSASLPNVFLFYTLFYKNSLFCIASFSINKENYVLNNQQKT